MRNLHQIKLLINNLKIWREKKSYSVVRKKNFLDVWKIWNQMFDSFQIVKLILTQINRSNPFKRHNWGNWLYFRWSSPDKLHFHNKSSLKCLEVKPSEKQTSIWWQYPLNEVAARGKDNSNQNGGFLCSIDYSTLPTSAKLIRWRWEKYLTNF